VATARQSDQEAKTDPIAERFRFHAYTVLGEAKGNVFGSARVCNGFGRFGKINPEN
jgi:hypothetical protein